MNSKVHKIQRVSGVYEFFQKVKKQKMFLMFLLPGVVFFIIFSYIPLYGIISAFQQYDPLKGFLKSEFVGFDNFKLLFSIPDFLRVLRNTVTISFCNLVFGFPTPIILALLINEIHFIRFKRITQTFSYIPYFISWAVLRGIWYRLLASDGIINEILQFLKLTDEPIYFMSLSNMFVPIIIVSGIWKGVGFSSIIFLAALASINPEMYESAKIDGAKKFQQIIYISIPAIMPTISLMFILQLASILNVNFEQIYAMYNLQVRSTADVIDTYLARIVLEGQLSSYSRGMAFGFLRAMTTLILFFSCNKIIKRFGIGSIY